MECVVTSQTVFLREIAGSSNHALRLHEIELQKARVESALCLNDTFGRYPSRSAAAIAARVSAYASGLVTT